MAQEMTFKRIKVIKVIAKGVPIGGKGNGRYVNGKYVTGITGNLELCLVESGEDKKVKLDMRVWAVVDGQEFCSKGISWDNRKVATDSASALVYGLEDPEVVRLIPELPAERPVVTATNVDPAKVKAFMDLGLSEKDAIEAVKKANPAATKEAREDAMNADLVDLVTAPNKGKKKVVAKA